MKTLKCIVIIKNSKGYSLTELAIAMIFSIIILTQLISMASNNAVKIKNNYVKWKEEKYLELTTELKSELKNAY